MSSGWRSSPGRPSRFCRWRPSLPRSRGACSLQAGGPQRRDSRAFFWLVSLLISSLFWFLARLIIENKDGPTQKYLLVFGVLLSVFIQEMFRFAYYRLLKKASEGLKTINPDEAAPSMQLLAYVSGLGFGIMSGVFSFVNTLSNSLGPGTVGIHGDSPQFFLNSAFMTLVIILLHVFWGIVFFDACEKKKWYVLLIVLLTHLLVSAQVSIGAVRTLSFGTQVCV
ncbi:PREDICTED: gamma-secretase subunit APH-1B isoform X1 [Chinchilla lanigera]|uniref:gamma-secretase subunit APH-1B isoform X1 n=1 Tax=Chinchilla lanigera TaxID=34839 RepID=UPI000698E87F|nr:PREDICTED: gamma-secretase subunit APH-1B isoform X1 [Chinchilla lanigera]